VRSRSGTRERASRIWDTEILRLEASVDEVGEEIYDKVLQVASGMQSSRLH
jgi:altronate dehydratase